MKERVVSNLPSLIAILNKTIWQSNFSINFHFLDKPMKEEELIYKTEDKTF